MKQLFPSEIIHNSAENYFTRQLSTSKMVYIILIATLIIFLISLPLIKVDITSQSNGIVRSSYEDNLTQSAVYGQVVRSSVNENSIVKQGDTLVILSTDKTDEQINFYNLELFEDSLQIKDLNSLLESTNPTLVTSIFRQEYAGFLGKLDEQNIKNSQAQKEFLLASKLFEKNVIPRMEYEQKMHSKDYEISHLKNIIEQQKVIWQTKLTELQKTKISLRSSVEQLLRDKRQYVITAPIGGTLTDCSGIKEGNFMVPNQQIARISPDNDLIVECFVSPANIGLIHNDMNVSFQFHSYNYNQWGIGTGKVTRISGNIFIINDQPFFKVRCHLDRNYLSLKNGTKGIVKKGMTLTGRFMITNRSLFQLIYDKTDDWINPKITNEQKD